MTNLICIVCPKGCRLLVDEQNDFLVTGHGCSRGETYGKKELTNPTRVLTSIVKIDGAIHPCCPVKTSDEIPKDRIAAAMELLKGVRLHTPVSIGNTVISNIGVDWIVTKDLSTYKNEEQNQRKRILKAGKNGFQ